MQRRTKRHKLDINSPYGTWGQSTMCQPQRQEAPSIILSGLNSERLPWVCLFVDEDPKTQRGIVWIPGAYRVAWLCLTLCNPMVYTVHGVLQVRILERGAIPFSRGSSQPWDWTQVSCIVDGFFTSWATGEALIRGSQKQRQPQAFSSKLQDHCPLGWSGSCKNSAYAQDKPCLLHD